MCFDSRGQTSLLREWDKITGWISGGGGDGDPLNFWPSAITVWVTLFMDSIKSLWHVFGGLPCHWRAWDPKLGCSGRYSHSTVHQCNGMPQNCSRVGVKEIFWSYGTLKLVGVCWLRQRIWKCFHALIKTQEFFFEAWFLFSSGLHFSY